MRESPSCADCGRSAFHTKPGDGGGRVCRTCFAEAHHEPCPGCDERRPPWRRPAGTLCGLCVTRAAWQETMDAHRDVVVAVVGGADADLSSDSVSALVERIAPGQAQRRLLATSVSSDPEWCAGSVMAPVVVERLIAGLAALGSQRFQPPRCGTCGRAAHCVGRAEDASRLCKACDHRRRTLECPDCGRHRPVGGRLSDGRMVCSTCIRSHPERRECCVECGYLGIVHRRDADGGSMCPRCYMRRARSLQDVPGLRAVCIDCGRDGFCVGVSTGEPRCPRCYPKCQAPCAGCGDMKAVAVVWAAGPHCHLCRQRVLDATGACAGCGKARRIDPRIPEGRQLCSDCAGLEPLSTCLSCGVEARLWDKGRCSRCTLLGRLQTLFDHAPAEVARQLAPLRVILEADTGSRHTMDWLSRRGGGRVLAQLLDGTVALSHDGLDQVGTKDADHIRHLLVSIDILAERDEEIARLERWTDEQVTAVVNAEDRHLVETFAIWHVLRRQRQRSARRDGSGDTTYARRTIRAAVELLGWLRQRDRPLAEITQADADLWVASGPKARRHARAFLDWASDRRVAPRVAITTRPRSLPAASLTAAQLEDFIRRLATDDSLPVAERVGGLLVALYGQTTTRLVRLKTDDVDMTGEKVTLRLGRNNVELPPLLARLVADLVVNRQGVARVGASTGPWLFPGGRPGRPLTADSLGARIADHGLPVGPLRTHALLELAAELPAAVLADLLGISASTAVRWGQAASGQWANYAAVRSRSATPR